MVNIKKLGRNKMKALNDLEKRIAEYSDTFDEDEAKMIRKRVQNAGADEVFNSMSTKELKEFAGTDLPKLNGQKYYG